jgi:zinc transport system ATP-binding protein
MNAVEIQNLNLNYSDLNVLKDINITIKDKEFTAIIGPNGGGKTTLLKIILGLIKPSSGKVKVYGKTSSYKKNLIGYVPQFTKFEKNFPINVIDVVLMGRLKYGRKIFQKYSKKDIDIAENIMKSLGIYELKDRQIGQLSGGQMQKVLIARALCMEPKLLLLDEPTASIDIKSKNSIYSLLKDLNKDITIIIVTHDTGTIFSYTDRVFYLNKTLYNNEADIVDGSDEASINNISNCSISQSRMRFKNCMEVF